MLYKMLFLVYNITQSSHISLIITQCTHIPCNMGFSLILMFLKSGLWSGHSCQLSFIHDFTNCSHESWERLGRSSQPCLIMSYISRINTTVMAVYMLTWLKQSRLDSLRGNDLSCFVFVKFNVPLITLVILRRQIS